MKPILTLAAATAVITQPLAAEPEILKEIREENGKKVEYTFIDGVKVHETDPAKQPPPKVVTPKPYDAEKAKAPEGAIVLFDGTEESLHKNWTSMKGGETKWKLVDGAMESVRGAGYIRTKDEFGSCRLHVEFATPKNVKGDGQGRGNSGVFLMGIYEVQVLDSYENATYPDGQCGALYGRAVPKVNACRPPGEWQTYDITFQRPIFDESGKVLRKARFTVVHNGEVIHDNVELSGGTGWRGPHSISEYEKHGDTGPISFQDHGNPVRFRNVWIQKLEEQTR
ncbi:hypothetical protein HAHE_27270 [Haloferula helveola]|uniref:3-keto-alpha-glucoside-1,2-lyase/3-keto-2-hydroxy-glucal hydratase domain-containing protein n=1 Tax=Haloferula helveola TaxID=490095 RepID=A0ABM7RG94_9BACT|nr:hypothetical protein HAHE_27270 [Haloferula helveola]